MVHKGIKVDLNIYSQCVDIIYVQHSLQNDVGVGFVGDVG